MAASSPRALWFLLFQATKAMKWGKQEFTFAVQKTLWNGVDADSLLLSGQADLFTDLPFPGYLSRSNLLQ